VRFIAYGDRHRIFGWVRLRADRLTDLLDAHDELHLSDVKIETLDDGVTPSVEDIIVGRRELVAVQATGPRGDASRRHPTSRHPIAVESGSYLIAGHLHVDPGIDPIASIAGRPAMVPLTDAWIEYWSGGDLKHRSTGTIIVNREKADRICVVSEEELNGGRLRPSRPSVRPA